MIGFWNLVGVLLECLPLWAEVLIFVCLNGFLFTMIFKAVKASKEVA